MKKELTSKQKRESAKKLGIAFVKKDGKIHAKQGNRTVAVGKSASQLAEVICFSKN